ncbi:MAG: sulfurylase [Deltaproteobacteria bacterium]|nr:MAG: sulfurylase [Deltaproteobacteria bacterium]
MTASDADPYDLPPRVLAEVYDHARAEYPNECCGYLIGDGDDVEVVRCTNRQDELHATDPETFPRTARTAYQIAGRELLALVRSFDSDRPATIIYHSHPDVGAYFSEEDTRAALAAGYPVAYLVVDVRADRVAGAVLFVREGNRYVERRRFGPPPSA